MKRIKLFLGIVVCVGIVSVTMSQAPAEKPTENPKDSGDRSKVLIDFTQYEQIITDKAKSGYIDKNPEGWERNPTSYRVTANDMALENWVVRFNSSSNVTESRIHSYTKKIQTKDGKTVLGARIHFPKHPYYSHAHVGPLYEILEYDESGNEVNTGNGVVRNVSYIKDITVEVGGRNYNNRLILRLMDQDRGFKDIFIGYLNFAGWREILWKNPEYIADPSQRSFFRPRLYPRDVPYYKFYAFVISRPEGGVKGDFVVYFKKVKMTYDLMSVDKDILGVDDEKNWGIKRNEYLRRQAMLSRKNSYYRLMRSIEQKRMGKNAEPADLTKKEENKEDKPK